MVPNSRFNTPYLGTGSKSCKLIMGKPRSLLRFLGFKCLHQVTRSLFLLLIAILVGNASWYSTEVCKPGKQCLTANGSDLYELEKKEVNFCAAWGFPFKTRLRISSHGRQTACMVLDRGPNRRFGNRVIDLNRRSFKTLAPLEEGLIEVKVEEIS